MEGRGGSLPRELSLVVQQRQKWLNVIFDLNGVLCHCEARSTIKIGSRAFKVEDNSFSDRTPTVVGTKAVYVRPNLHEFLIEVSKIACRVVIWSSMLKKSVEPIAMFLFQNSKPPFDILEQEKCRMVETSQGKFLVEEGNPFKLLFLKVLGEQLFLDPDDLLSFSKENSILIDDSPQKGILNEIGNGLFLERWNRYKRGDKVLLESLAPWLK